MGNSKNYLVDFTGQFKFLSNGAIIVLNTAILLYCLFYIFIVGVHFEDNAAMFKLMMSGAEGYTQGSHHLNDFIGWQELLEWLYSVKPDISWLPITLLFFTCASIIITGNCILLLSVKNGISKLLTVGALIFLISVLSGNILWLHHNRLGFLMSGSALFAMATLLNFKSSLSVRQWRLLHAIIWLWFLGGVFFRFEAGIVTLIMMLPVILIMHEFAVKQIWKSYAPFFAIAGLLIIIYVVMMTYHPSFYYQTEPDVEYEIVDRRNVIPISAMTTAEDSARYRAVAEMWMLGDVSKNTPEFMRSLIKKPGDDFNRFFFFLNKSEKGKKLIDFEKIALLISQYRYVFLFFVAVVFFTLLQHSLMLSLKIALFFCFSTLILSFSFSVNSFERVLEPVLGMISVMGFLILICKYPLRNYAATSVAAFTGLLLSLFLLNTTVKNAFRESAALAVHEEFIRNKVDSFMNKVDRKYVLMVMNFTNLNTGTFEPFVGYKDKQLLFMELYQFSGNEPFLNKIKDVTGCAGDDFKCRLNFLKINKDEVIIITKKEYIEFLDYYAKAVYNIDMNFSNIRFELLDDETCFWLP